MTISRFPIGVALAFAVALFGSSCATVPPRSVVVEPVRTYAVVVADDHGVLAATESQRVQIGIIQYLTDSGFVRPGDRYIADLLHADVVFRVRIAWQGSVGGFSVADVQPSYSGATAADAYQAGPPSDAAPWDDDPWDYRPEFDPYFGVYDPFVGFFPFLGLYAWDDLHPPRLIYREHNGKKRGLHRPRPPEGHSRYFPRPDRAGERRELGPGAGPHGPERAGAGGRPGWSPPHGAAGRHPPPDARRHREPRPDREALPRSPQAMAGARLPAPLPREHSSPPAPHYAAPVQVAPPGSAYPMDRPARDSSRQTAEP